MPWTLRYHSLDDRINGRADLNALRADEAVRSVTVSIGPDQGMEVRVDFHEGFDAPQDQTLRRQVGPYLVLEEVSFDVEPVRRLPRSQTMVEGFRRNYGLDREPPALDDETRQRIIERYLGSFEGRTQLAQAMVAPLRQRLDYQAIGRRTFLVEQMPEGALPVYTPEVHTPGHDTDYLALPGNLPLHSTKHYTDAELPPWTAVGSWVREAKPEGRIGMIVNHYRTEDRQRREHVHIIIGIWRTPDSVDLCAHHLVVGWEPCRQPPEPLTVWERILGGDDFVDE